MNEIEIDSEKLLKRLVYPHPRVSREVRLNDIERIRNEAQVLFLLCFVPAGTYKGAYGAHHSQIDDQDPLNFFVTQNKDIVINPHIINHTKTTVDSREGCLTFLDKEPIIVQRYHKIEVSYVTLMTDPKDSNKTIFSPVIFRGLGGPESKIWQHEIDHGLGKYIYPYEPKMSKEGLEIIS